MVCVHPGILSTVIASGILRLKILTAFFNDRPMMTDVLPHLLLYLGGISTPAYRPEYNVIAPEYDTKRPRILKGTTDYNTLKKK